MPAYSDYVAHARDVATGNDIQKVIVTNTYDTSFWVMVIAVAVLVFVAFQIFKWFKHKRR